jgi:hypothetical protein
VAFLIIRGLNYALDGIGGGKRPQNQGSEESKLLLSQYA